MIIAAAVLSMVSSFAAAQARVAGGVVSSKEWHVKRGAEKEEEFSGDVRYRSGSSVIKSDWALYKHETQTWQLRGNVSVDRVLEEGDRVQATGDRAFHDMKTEKGWLAGDKGVSFTRTPADALPDYGYGERVEWMGKDKIALIGAVRVWGPRMECRADRADYARPIGELLLTGGRPVLRKRPGWTEKDWDGAIQGDVVRAYEKERKLSADGLVSGWLEFQGVKDPRRRR